MVTVLWECSTEDERSVVFFYRLKDSMQRIFIKKWFLVYGEKFLSHKAVHIWFEKFSQGLSNVADDETVVQKWLRQQSKDFYTSGFEALVKRWNKCINIGRGYVEK
jgi:hypothetical protein